MDRTNRLTLAAVPDELALAVIGRPPDKPAASPDQLDLLLVARLGRCLAEYGEFSLPLLALEIGMHHVQLVLLARALGWEVTMNHQVAAHAFQDVTQANHWSDLPLLRLAVRGPGIGAAVPSLPSTSRVQKRTQAPADDDGFAGLRLLVVASQSDAEEAIGRRAHRAAPPPSRPGPTFDPFALAERRSSGRAAQAWCGDWAWETVDDYFRTVAALLTDGMPGAAEQGAPLSSIAITIRAKRDDPVALYAFDHRTGRRQAIRGTDRMMAAATASLDRNTRLAVTIGVDDLAALERFGARAFVEAHLTAGAIGHCFCLAAAAHDMTARPVCSFIAAEANLLLPLEARALLQVQIEPRCGMPPDYLVT